MEKLLLTAQEAAEALGIGKTKVYDLIAAGSLESVKIGGCRRVLASSLRTFIEGLFVSRT